MKEVLLTGGAGFVGSNLIEMLNQRGIVPHVLENWPDIGEKWRNLRGLQYVRVDRDSLWLVHGLSTVIHLGARVDTREKMNPDLWDTNVNLLSDIVKGWTVRGGPPKIIYASSAAVYGNEETDFSERIVGVKPVNAYAFTKWSLDQDWAGKDNIYSLRFFNVYGPREQHKGDMASLVHKGLTKQAPLYCPKRDVGALMMRKENWSLFKSYRPDIKDGEQARDFVHVEDVCKVILHFLDNTPEAGIYNVGSGIARTFNDLVQTIDPTLPIEYVEMPEVLRNQYQYRTCADLTKLRGAGYQEPFLTLERGIEKTREWLKANS